ncbi:MAG: flippase-like protein [Myxococcales bacterium]|nr:flippase-like protein [Myxococcales bacterium]
MAARRASTIFNVVVLLIGAVALGLLLHNLGWDSTRRAILHTGLWFAVIAAIDLASVSCDAFAVHGFLRPRVRVAYWKVFAAQVSGLAINRLTPANSLGEPVKVTMLSRHVPTNVAVSAIVMFNLTTIYFGIAAIVIGVPLTALMLELPHRVAVVVWIGMFVLIGLAIAIAVIVRRGAVATLIDLSTKLRVISVERGARWRLEIAEIDTRLRELGDAQSSGFKRGLLGVLGSRVFNWTGTVAVLYAANIPMTASLVIASLSVGILITWMSNVIPLGLGLADGTNYALYGLLGASPEAGLVFTMVNRLRTVVLAMLGLAIMTLANFVHRSRTEHERVTRAEPR